MRQADRPGLPYHRVIAAGGRLGGYSSLALKRSLLAAEGLTVTPRRVVGFARSPLARRSRNELGEVREAANWPSGSKEIDTNHCAR